VLKAIRNSTALMVFAILLTGGPQRVVAVHCQGGDVYYDDHPCYETRQECEEDAEEVMAQADDDCLNVCGAAAYSLGYSSSCELDCETYDRYCQEQLVVFCVPTPIPAS
jgi:hypothetical protein